MVAGILLFLFGLSVGSFLNVLTLRYKPDGKLFDLPVLSGRSYCPYCKRALEWFELIPLFSFLIQQGRCRKCGVKISFQYPLVELLSGLIFVFVPYAVNPIESIFWVLIFLSFLTLSVIDFRHLIIPDEINIGLFIFAGALLMLQAYYGTFNSLHSQLLGHYGALFGLRNNVWFNHFVGLVFGALVIFFPISISKGKWMGVGDLKFAAALGLIFGWPEIIIILMLAFVLGALAGLPLLILGRKNMKDAVPFGPFLAASSTIVFFFGYNIINSYFKLIGLIV